MLSLLYLVVKTQQYFVTSSCMFLGEKTVLEIWPNPVINLTIFRGTGPRTPSSGIYSKWQMLSVELSSCCSYLAMFLGNILTWNESNVPRQFCYFVLTTKTTQPRPQVFSVKGSITCNQAALLTSFSRHQFNMTKLFPKLVNSSWLWWIMHVVLTNQKRRNILNEL